MQNWRKICVGPNDSLEHTMQVIDAGAERIALVTDPDMHLLGVVTDGDIRRALLRHMPLDVSISQVMTTTPIVAKTSHSREERKHLMDRRGLYHIPVLTEDGRLSGLDTLREVMGRPVYDNPVVLMAGGLGSRLGPLTKNRPKPLLEVGPKPLLQTIVESIASCGFHKFYISVNYHADQIMQHFGDGSDFGVEISYLVENKRLGTAGPLSLITERPDMPVLVMNGDILTKIDFESLLTFHRERQSLATMSVREYGMQVPFGTVSVVDGYAVELREKPVQHYFINAGIYVLDPSLIDRVPKDKFFDMPDLLQQVIDNREPLSVFPIHEYWHDIGRPEDFERAQVDFQADFV